MQDYQNVEHTFGPIYDKNSKILILGSFPSVKSREMQFYYGHPQNRFWRVLAFLLNEDIPNTIEDKKQLLIKNHIAVWDVIASCSISGSSDTSIKDVIVNDFTDILQNSKIEKIFVNGTKAYELYRKYAENRTGIKAIKLPSTSPANAAWSFEKLCEAWGEQLQVYSKI